MIENIFSLDRERLAYPLDEAAPLIGISKSKLRKDIAAGKVKAKLNGRKVVILRSDLMEYLNSELTDWTPLSERASA